MISRERVRLAINHKEADRIPLDLGSTLVTGIQASIYAKLKNALGISKGLVRLYDSFQMIAEAEDEVKQSLGVDTYGIQLPVTIFGYKNENWKTFYHSCGSNVDFLDDFVSAGIDILNSVQISATGMNPDFLKKNYGDKFVFWGGGVDTQKTLPFGTPENVKEEVENNMRIFGKNGGFIFNTVHNIQATVPVNNLVIMFKTVRKKGSYNHLKKQSLKK